MTETENTEPTMATAPATRSAPPLDGYFYATWSRLGAVIIDGIIVLILQFLVSLVVGVVLGITGLSMEGMQMFDNIASIIVGWLYFAIQESSEKQATVGKAALGLIVTDMNGQRISFMRATGRYFAKIISAAILLIGYIMILFTEKKQGLHDILAGCLILRKQK